MTFKELEVGEVAYRKVIRRYILKLSERRYFDLGRKKVCGIPPDYSLDNDIYDKAYMFIEREKDNGNKQNN